MSILTPSPMVFRGCNTLKLKKPKPMDSSLAPPQKLCLGTETHFFITRAQVLVDFERA